MIYCTMSIGESHSLKYSNDINEFAKHNEVYVLTNYPEYFQNCIIQNYNRNIFSYYEKLPFFLSLVNEYKKRVVYFDVDSINLIKDNNFVFDNESAYSYKIFKNTNYTDTQLRKFGALNILCDIYSELGYKMCDYLGEAVISIPYSQNINKIFKEIVKLQPLFEEKYPKGKKWNNHDLNYGHDFNRYSRKGCGYGEGGAISVVLRNNNIKILKLKKNKLI